MTRREALAALLALPDDTTARLLERNFSRPELSYVLLDVSSRRPIAIQWTGIERGVPVGSLAKPLVAFAYPGTLPHGLPQAIAFSDNAYFLALAREITAPPLGLPPPRPATPEAWIGLGGGWRIPPLDLLRAYCDLVARGPREILEGLRLSAKIGTSRAIHCDAFAKTGTAPCRHTPRSAGDGYSLSLYPAASPRVALLVSLDGAPGAQAAAVAGRMLKLIA